jgi:Family of unknown function (DUF5681)
MTEIAGEKQANGRFQPGQSGNPAGTAKGTRARATILAEKLMLADEQEIVASVIQAAKGGDMTAARLVLERIAPVRKGRPITLALPLTNSAAAIAEAMAVVVAQMAVGEVTPEEATTVVGILDAKRKAIELVEIEARIQALEAKTNQ